MSKDKSERVKKRDHLLAEAQRMPGISEALQVLVMWQQLDTITREIQAAKPRTKIVSAANTSR